MIGFRSMSRLLILIILGFTFNNLSEARHVKALPSAVVVGTVYCDTCFQEDFSKGSHYISGALVAVECGDNKSLKPNFHQEVKTNEQGQFKVHLPFSVGKHVKKIKGCSVKLINSSEPYCAVASTATSSLLHLKSRKQGTHIFSAGFFTFKPLKQPYLCNQKPSFLKSKELNSVKSLITNSDDPAFPSPIQDPPMPMLPPLPQLPKLPPLPQLPPLPTLPGIPYFPPAPQKATPSDSLKASQLSPIPFLPLPPNPFRPPSVLPPNPFQPPPSILPPNPFQPPPSILPPNPFQPPPSILPPNPFQPPPSILPPNPFQPPPSVFPPILPSPPPSPLINFPPIPGFTPSPPPPPAFSFPLPPFPFQPSPGSPPPAFSSPSKKTSP